MRQLLSVLTKGSKRFKRRAILIRGCHDSDHIGAFTARLLMAWKRGASAGNDAISHAEIKSGMLAAQTPNPCRMVHVAVYLKLQPFTV